MYVGGLQYAVIDSQLEEMFAKFGSDSLATAIYVETENEDLIGMKEVNIELEQIVFLSLLWGLCESSIYCITNVFTPKPLFIKHQRGSFFGMFQVIVVYLSTFIGKKYN